MSDPSSFNVSISVSGMSEAEATVLIRNIPDRSRFSGIREKAVGPSRYRVEVTDMSIMGAAQLSADLLRYVQSVAEDDE